MPFPSPGEAHVYYIDLTKQATAVYLPLLSFDEHLRAERYRVEHARTQFVVTRGALRTLLGRYSDCDPAQIAFSYGAAGKPSLASPAGLEFSVSHSGDLAALVFACDCELGIDIEHIRPMPEMLAIARAQFSPDECSELFAAPEQNPWHQNQPQQNPAQQNQQQMFFRFWTRKEALAKASGLGITADLSHTVHWFRHDLEPGPGYVGTLFAGKPVHLQNISFP